MTKDIIIKGVQPLGRYLVTTADRYEEDFIENGVVKFKAGETKKYQRVVSVGKYVTNVKEGDLVMVSPNRYAVPQYNPNSVKSDMGANKVISYNIPTLEIDGVLHMLLIEEDIMYVITNFEEVENEAPQVVEGEK